MVESRCETRERERERERQTDTDVEGAETPIPLGGRSLGKISVK